ncbi:hypothetical protein EXIGLDRAFT_729164 [Exidia glandulosa HHB12029]|uniref:F-box domain-containing protein n=1 Tax=Exidia glandulosa HHB12029 TaxID=1314781 RepID=A0A165LKW7_EXIGL|nr:hypothetical protein EXIGLDRAFT_729164 [Exidia glandulosa HHB12029]
MPFPLDEDNAFRAAMELYANGIFAGISVAADVTTTTHSMLISAQEGLSAAAYTWNCSYSPSYQLPDELLASCFELLSFRDLIAATHVTRQWRTVAHNFPRLWANIYVTAATHDSKFRLLGVLLQRSRSSPVDVSLQRPGGSYDHYLPELATLVAEHMDHVRSLHWDSQYLEGLFVNTSAPVLRTLDMFPPQGDGMLPPDLFKGDAPNLRVLHLRAGFNLPTTCAALHNLRVFRGTLNQGTSCLRLFRLCPLLEELDLCNLYSPHQLPILPAPRSLQRLSLRAASPFTINYSNFLNGLLHKLRSVVIGRPHQYASFLNGLPQALGPITSISVESDIDPNDPIVVLHDKDGFERGISLASFAMSPAAQSMLADALERVDFLDVPLSRMKAVVTATDLPSLKHLRILDDSRGLYDFTDPSTFRVPSLSKLTWSTPQHDHIDSLTHIRRFVKHMLVRPRSEGQLLDELEIVYTPDDSTWREGVESHSLRDIARRVTVDTHWKDGSSYLRHDWTAGTQTNDPQS